MINGAVCFIEDCNTKVRAHGMCRSHYEKWRRCGDPLGERPLQVNGTPEERFWHKVDKRGPDECWEWRAARDSYGYGIFSMYRPDKGRYMNMLAHRYSYILHGGDLPVVGTAGRDEETIDHLCHNRACVNPAHMEVVPHEENSRRAIRGVSEQMAAVACVVVLHRKGRITSKAVAEELDVTPRSARIGLNKLRTIGWLRLIPGPYAYWEIVSMKEAA